MLVEELRRDVGERERELLSVCTQKIFCLLYTCIVKLRHVRCWDSKTDSSIYMISDLHVHEHLCTIFVHNNHDTCMTKRAVFQEIR